MSDPASETNGQQRVVIRKAFICVHCDAVYADEPVTNCECLDGTGHDFIEGKIEYTKSVYPCHNWQTTNGSEDQ